MSSLHWPCHAHAQQTQNICITFIQCWTNVEDVGPTLYKGYTNVCVCWECGWTALNSRQIKHIGTKLETFTQHCVNRSALALQNKGTQCPWNGPLSVAESRCWFSYGENRPIDTQNLYWRIYHCGLVTASGDQPYHIQTLSQTGFNISHAT